MESSFAYKSLSLTYQHVPERRVMLTERTTDALVGGMARRVVFPWSTTHESHVDDGPLALNSRVDQLVNAGWVVIQRTDAVLLRRLVSTRAAA